MFSDFHPATEDLVVDGDTVWIRMVGTGINKGDLDVADELTSPDLVRTISASSC